SWVPPRHAITQMNLRVPHPWFVRVGSYALTSQTLFSSLLGLSCPCRARLLRQAANFTPRTTFPVRLTIVIPIPQGGTRLFLRAAFWRVGPFSILSSRPEQRRLPPLRSGG